jgi:hypothetical protein
MLAPLHVMPKMYYMKPQETEQRRLSAVKSMQNIIDSIIYAMYTRKNFEYCWGSWFGSFLDIAFILFSPMPKNKQGEFKEMIEDGCSDEDDGWAEDYGFGMF